MAFSAPFAGAGHDQFHPSHTGAGYPPDYDGAERVDGGHFDIFEWYPAYQSCQKYFLDHAQHSPHVKAVAAFVNISLPCQRQPQPVLAFATPSPHPPAYASASPLGLLGRDSQPNRSPRPHLHASINESAETNFVTVIPFLRRLIATGLDFPGVLHGFFGDDWVKGVGPMHEQERRNYLFAAKSGGWAGVKKDYDMGPSETVPFLRPLMNCAEQELDAAEKTWSEWLAMEDWMVGPRAPEQMDESRANRTTRHHR